jgi:hypothetical protein
MFNGKHAVYLAVFSFTLKKKVFIHPSIWKFATILFIFLYFEKLKKKRRRGKHSHKSAQFSIKHKPRTLLQMELGTYTRSIGRRFGSCSAWHRFARRLVARGLVKRYPRTLDCGMIVDGYVILDLEKLKSEVR